MALRPPTTRGHAAPHSVAQVGVSNQDMSLIQENTSLPSSPPNIIGATGGSGTRVIARLVSRGGMFIGERLNESEDAIDFGEFSDAWINSYLNSTKASKYSHVAPRMMQDMRRVLTRHCSAIPHGQPWGWKEPRSILLLPFFHQIFPSMKFLHVVRDGRDMAYSGNQNQLAKHGRAVLKLTERFKSRPLRSMIMWSRVNLSAANYGERHLRENYMLLRFEDLCSEPIATINRVFEFLGLVGDAEEIAREEVAQPESLGRWRERDEGELHKLHLLGACALEKFGYLAAERAAR